MTILKIQQNIFVQVIRCMMKFSNFVEFSLLWGCKFLNILRTIPRKFLDEFITEIDITVSNILAEIFACLFGIRIV